MKTSELKSISESLINTFNDAGKISIDLFKKGLKIEIKKDKSPVSNGDLEVNEIITAKIKSLTPNPVAPPEFKAPPYFEKAIPAISKWAHGVLFKINLCKNWAAVVDPAPPT